MAKKERTGLDYYNIDTDLFMNRKVRRLIKNFSGNGFMVYSFVLTEIYRDKGYFIEWDNNTAFDVSDAINVKETLVNEVVNYCCSVGLFNKELLTSENVLTTKNIQDFWVKVSKSAKRKNQSVNPNISLITEFKEVKAEFKPLKQEFKEVKAEFKQQSKVKESKGNKIKENYTSESNALTFLKRSEFDYLDFEMKNKKNVKDWDLMLENYNYKVDEEKLLYETKILVARLKRWMGNWIRNENKHLEKKQKYQPELKKVHSNR